MDFSTKQTIFYKYEYIITVCKLITPWSAFINTEIMIADETLSI